METLPGRAQEEAALKGDARHMIQADGPRISHVYEVREEEGSERPSDQHDKTEKEKIDWMMMSQTTKRQEAKALYNRSSRWKGRRE